MLIATAHDYKLIAITVSSRSVLMWKYLGNTFEIQTCVHDILSQLHDRLSVIGTLYPWVNRKVSIVMMEARNWSYCILRNFHHSVRVLNNRIIDVCN